jgi:hypothetical protein
MDAITLVTQQLEGINAMVRDVIGGIPDELWTQRAYPGANPLGFTAWHLPATRDWAIHTWIQGVPEVRERPPFVSSPVNQPYPPFGMSADEAAAIARAVPRADVLAYLDATHEALLAHLKTMTDVDLERVPDTRRHGFRLPAHQAPGYVEEVQRMLDFPVWKLLSGPCYGHPREHIGGILSAIESLRTR